MRHRAGALFNQKRAFRFFGTIFFCVTSLCACSPREPRADLVLINTAEPESIDPAIIRGQPDGRVAMSLFEGLTRFDPRTAKPIPGLAEL